MNHPIYPSTAQLWDNIVESVEDGVGVGVISVLFSQGIPWLRHGELALHFVEHYPCPLLFHVSIQVLGKDRRHTDITQAKHVLRVGLALVTLK